MQSASFFFPERNECKNNDGLCEFGNCVDTVGSFKCECNEGYVPSKNGKRCIGKFVSWAICLQKQCQ